MKKAKRAVLLSIFVILLVCALLFCYVWFAPFGRHKAANSEAIETEIRVPPPDSVAVIRGGIATEVSEEQRDQIYAAFAQAFEQQLDHGTYMCPIGRLEITKCVIFNINIEFRYRQRRQFLRMEYDAVLFSFDADDQLIPIYLCDGQYIENHSYSVLRFDEAYFTEFKKTIKGII